MAAGVGQCLAAGKPGRGQRVVAGPTQRRLQQKVVVGRHPGTVQPGVCHGQVLLKTSVHKRLLRRGQAQRQHIPADHLGAGRQFGAQLVACPTAAVGDGLHGQPFQPRAIGQLELHRLQRQRTFTAVKACGTRRGDERVCAGLQRGLHMQFVATHHTTRRVHQDVVADGRPFGVKALQHAQRAFVVVVRAGAVALPRVMQRELGLPVQGRAQKSLCSAAISSSTSATGPVTRMAFWPRANTSRQGRSSVGLSPWLPVSCSRRASLMP